MGFDIKDYCQRIETALLSEFGEKVCYIGLQGSYLRGEATENSDIDIMVILAELTIADMDTYRGIIENLGDFEKSCGFICSLTDMKNWNPLEICQLKYTTKDIYGRLEDFLPKWTLEDERNYVKVSLNNLYHALCHSYIHGNRSDLQDSLVAYYKAAFFILQNLYYLETCRSNEQTEEFILTKAELVTRLRGEDKDILETTLYLINGGEVVFDVHFSTLLSWCQSKMKSV